MKWLVLLGLVALSECIVILPLRKVKTLRETLREKNLLNNFLEERAYRLFKNDSKTTILPLRNFLDVSLLGGWLSTPPPCIGNLVSLEQSFGLSLVEYGFNFVPFDGILGLAFPTIAIEGTIPIFDNLWFYGAFSEPVFAFYLSKSKPEGSVVMFGGVDHRYYKGELNWIPVSQTRHWQISMNRITMNENVVACSRGCHATLNTGTSVIYGPTEQVTNIHKLMNAKLKDSEYVVSCDAVNTLPPVIFNINGIDYPLPPQAYIIKIQNSCRSIFQGGTEASSRDTWILGDVFLRQYFSVFDRKNERIGLAPAV
nr:pregnancy-associated glycoprotein 2-like [Odocoileus virginianus texanus]